MFFLLLHVVVSMRMQLLRNVYIAIIVLQSIIHSQNSQDLNIRKTYQKYDMISFQLARKQYSHFLLAGVPYLGQEVPWVDKQG